MPANDNIAAQISAMMRQRREQQEQLEQPEAPLKGSGGGGTSDGMEERVTRLERNFDQLSKDVVDVRVQLATLNERVAHLPGKGFIVTATSTIIALIGALTLFADKLQALIH